MKYLFLFALLSFSTLFCGAQNTADLPPKITFHRYRSVFGGWNSYYMLGDSVLNDQEMGHYLKVNYPLVAGSYQKGLKLRRKARYSAVLGLAGAALGLLTRSRQLDYIGYGGFILGETIAGTLGAWGNRKMGEGVYYYNQERERMLRELQREPVYERQKRRIEVMDIEQ